VGLDRGDVDDRTAALVRHPRSGEVAGRQHRGEVELHQGLPATGAGFEEGAVERASDDVDQDVRDVPDVVDPCEELPERVGLADVE
jgi:hypothetical protein